VDTDLRRAFRLEYLTIGWNLLEGIVALTAGILALSVALTAFGLDSVIEVFAAFVVIRELRGHADHTDAVERRFLRLIGASFFLLALYVVIQSVYDLVGAVRPERSIPGIALTTVSASFMWWLAATKHRAGHRIDCLPLIADSRETRLCALLSVVTLAGLVLNAALGWWWADPVAGLGVAALAVREGREAWSGEHPEHHA